MTPLPVGILRPNGYLACIEEERIALLDIKLSVTADGHSFFQTWNISYSSDCCRWDRIRCSPITKRITNLDLSWDFQNGGRFSYYTLNISLFLPFKELRSLVLFNNGNTACLPIDCFQHLVPLKRLEYLDISANYFDGKTLASLAALRSLRGLAMSGNGMQSDFFISALGDWLRMNRLKYLDVSSNSLNATIVPFLAGLTSLESLFLSDNQMQGRLPFKELSGLNKLETLDLSWNEFSGDIPSMENEWNSLKVLSLFRNRLNGTSLEGLCKTKKLQELDLSLNELIGDLPFCLGNLSSLKFFAISNNQLKIDFPSAMIKNLTMLEYVFFNDNNFKGTFPVSSLVNHSELKLLDLSNNNLLEVQTEYPSLLPSFQLEGIILANCIVNSSILTFLSSQNYIRYIDLSNSNMNGDISTWLFENKTNLNFLDFHNNSLTGQLIFPPHVKINLSWLDLSNNKLIGEIPVSFGFSLPNLKYLNMSRNLLQGPIPPSFSHIHPLEYLGLSNNNLSGQPSDSIGGLHQLDILDLSKNKFHGKLLAENSSLPSLSSLLMNDNQFVGEIPSYLCQSRLMFVDISENQLSGMLPSCLSNLSLFILNVGGNNLEGHLLNELCNFSSLQYLDLSSNHFFGEIPSCFNLSNLDYLNLNDNLLTGLIPNALSGSPLKILDIGNNEFFGDMSSWIRGAILNLEILSLKGNLFTGPISEKICNLEYLRILDLSHNNFSGQIPSCFHNIGHVESLQYYALAMNTGITWEFRPSYKGILQVKDYGGYLTNIEVEDIDFETKSRSYTYKGAIINYFSGLDLSCNQLVGKIPVEMGNMSWLRALNLSNNLLSGPIPDTLSRLTDIESLDLSHNMLTGSIPTQLAELYFIEVFSVAHNNLSGPTLGRVSQFSTFDESSYEGNPYLCGPPLVKNCAPVPSPQQDDGENDYGNEETIDKLIFFASFTLAFIIGFWGWMALLYFKISWRYYLFLAVDNYSEEVLFRFNNLVAKTKSCFLVCI
ncbi:putative non-specific serine/threonine protein kinase [Dioscorea sansibarensis]